MDIESVRENERWKGIANFGDNAALGSFVAGIAHGLGASGPDIWAVVGVLFGFAFLWMAWHTRGLIQSED